LKDTATPAKITGLSLLVNAASSAVLMIPLKVGGVALGSSIAAVFSSFFLYRTLRRKVGPFDWQDTPTQAVKVVIVSCALGLCSRFLWEALSFSRYINFGIIVCLDIVIFIAAGVVFKFRQIAYLTTWLQRVLKRK
jgi:putative peptidoglycan lipid II flippase